MPLERRITDACVRWLRERGYYVIKMHGEAMQERGLPDLIACIAGRFVGIEVKRPGLSANPLQDYHLDQIVKQGGEAYLVHSVDELERLLTDDYWKLETSRT